MQSVTENVNDEIFLGNSQTRLEYSSVRQSRIKPKAIQQTWQTGLLTLFCLVTVAEHNKVKKQCTLDLLVAVSFGKLSIFIES
jgi:hypothetical protein